ncbi:MAG: PqqD family protein [Acidimicrobiia bacterium]
MPYRRAEGVLSETADGRAMLAAASGNEVIVLNDTGTLVWRLLEDHDDADAITGLVHEAYPEIPRDDVARDVDAFLAELLAAQLVERT